MSADPPITKVIRGRDAIELLKHRVTSIKTDPLHSQAYLHGLKSYLDKPKAGSQHRPAAVYVPPDQTLPFAYTYDLSQSAKPLPKVYHTASEYLVSGPECSGKVPSIIIFAGYPSPEWLEVVLARCPTGFPFLHRHLDFMSSNQRDRHIGSEIPSRSTRVIRLLIPSIVFIGPEERHLPPQDLQKARRQCSDRLRQKSKSFFGGSSVSAGSSIIRNIHVHSGDTVVLEQMITITISRDGPQETVFIWNDAGSDTNKEYLIATEIDAFRGVRGDIAFCPIFFDTALNFEQPRKDLNPGDAGERQPLTALPGRFGETLDWEQITRDPVLCLQELFAFQCGAMTQYQNMMRKHINQLISRTHPTGDGILNMEDILDFDYSKTILVKFSAHLYELWKHLDTEAPNTPIEVKSDDVYRTKMLAVIRQDIAHLHEDSKFLIELCDAGRSMVLSSFSVMDSKRAAKEAQLVTALTKATTRVTFIFLPISLVTSVFGMNFSQFGQGLLSIWLWVEVSLPLLIVSIVMVEYGSSIKAWIKRVFT